ncbi:MAG: tail fiber protein [Sphingomonadaceae bacterium]|nr:tail fiber protein [Sphingomonadaceae bacterium]
MNDPLQPAPWFGPQGFGTVPVGSVVAFAGQLGTPVPNNATPPDDIPGTTGSPPATTAPIEAWGWMACDGRTLQTADYPELFAALGYVYGGSGASFALPDYRGYFLRGADWGAGNDPDAASRTAPPGGSAADIGSTQPSALLSHKHDFPQSIPAGTAPEGSDSGVPSTTQNQTGVPVADDGSAFTTQVSQNETRPINVYVGWIIKFTAALRPTAPLYPRNEGD